MFLVISDVLTRAEVQAIRDIASTLSFRDGRETAGGHAARVKVNEQAARSDALTGILKTVQDRLSGHPLFTSAARPKTFSNLILSRYNPGDTYGWHVDNAVMGGIRTDISFTLFLNDPDAYDGGSLMVQDTLETRQIKLQAGDLVLYPSTTLHQVEPVTRGQRLVVVGWVQSLIARADQREILFDLDRAIGAVGHTGDSVTLNLLTKTRSNLLRQWIDA